MRSPALPILALLASACGCLQGEPDSPITVETPVVDLGLVHGSHHRLQQPFTLRAWDAGPVTITKIETKCCGATPVTPDMTGHELAAGSSHVVFLTMNRSGVGPWTITANVLTDPPSPNPITMTLCAVLSGVPVVAPERLVVEQVPGEMPTATLRVSYMRTQQEEPLELDRQASSFSPFVLSDIESRTELIPSVAGEPDPPRWDQLTLKLSLEKAFPVGEHRFNLNAALKHGLTAPSARATVVVRHPCRPAASRLFLGELAPGETLERQVALVRSGEQKVRVASVDASSDRVTGKIGDLDDNLSVRAVAPEKPGRFEAVLTLKFAEPSVPAVSLDVAGIVKAPAQ